ncbi:MAG: hypothetical protein IPL60_02035 [Ardenticatenia bacterium]|nr:hypothetical protein [Ardenticatenia bacterium]
MTTPPPIWQPHYTLTPAIARGGGELSALYRQYIGNDAARATMTTHAFTDDQLDREPLTHA